MSGPVAMPSGGESAIGGDSAVVLGDAFQQVAQGLARLQEALRLQGQEAIRRQEEAERVHQEARRRQEQEAERRLLDALRRQEQRAETALREAVGQMVTKLQEKDDAISALEQRLEEMQQRVAVVEGRSESLKGSAEERALGRLDGIQERLVVVEGTAEGLEGSAEQGAVQRLEGRMQEVEASLQRAIEKFFPRVDGLLRQLQKTPPLKASSPTPPSTCSGEMFGESATGEGAAGGREDNPHPVASRAASSTSPACFTSSSTARSALRATAPEEAAGDRRGEPGAGQGTGAEDERLQRQRIERRIRDVKERVRVARFTYSPLEDRLLKAIRNGHLVDIEGLLACGAEVNHIDRYGFIPLLVAIQAPQREDVVALLLRRGADANAIDVFGATAMHLAAGNDRSGRCVDLLIAAGGDVNARMWTGDTPLHIAASKDNLAAVRALLSAGARRDLKMWNCPSKKTPLDCATSAEIRDLLRS